jgi:arsenite/tail-anchored protein-transporting ATPase
LFGKWREAQQGVLEEMGRYFDPVPMRRAPLFSEEVMGEGALERLGEVLYEHDEDPSAVTRAGSPYSFARTAGGHEVRLELPFAAKSEVGVFKKGDELVVEVGTLRRHVGLPTSMAALEPVRARLEERMLIVELEEAA